MDYPYEQLGPEKFQEFVQALLNKELPDVQSFPVAQPDGGRDAISYFPENDERKFIVYQVKYVRQPYQIEDPHQWLVDIIRKESDKVSKLIPKGAQKYILITNVKGTAHLDNGSIDKMQQIYDEEIDVPFICWWRDDINRKLDGMWDLKWTYSELMTGPDLIRSIIEKDLIDDNNRCSSAIRAFVKDQLERDKELRFKQVDLQNNLLDLYVDVPIVSSINHDTKARRKSLKTLGYVVKKIIYSDESEKKSFEDRYPWASQTDDFAMFLSDSNQLSIGAGSFFLNSEVQKHLPFIVLEGAPGQGKSTVTQYLAQIHRLKILKSNKFLNKFQKSAASRIPFKIDLRDFAMWLSKRNPFVIDNTEVVPVGWQKSLESFLAETVKIYSGGIEFSVNDIVSVSRLSAILLIFDGLDEIADITKRIEVVDEIVKGVNRISTNAASLQVIVTSRPAAFTNSPFFPEDSYNYIQLGNVTKRLVVEYTDKWIRARKLSDRDSVEVKKVIRDKIDQPHLRELTKNTMQLTILLSLIHSKGAALPDRRTALYDNYVDTFFDRESGKNDFVRDNRELLIDIHRYLAWKLHSNSEMINEDSRSVSGRITKENLISLLNDYLLKEHYDTSIVEKLFTGVVERVVAIVSRVEGTFEFEVQPLREYFTARYLYDNASPVIGEGTILERFDLISRSFYWLNVTRFYAGCYNRGELMALADSIKSLINDKDYRFISYPLSLVSMLLKDWVFSNNLKSLSDIVNYSLNSNQLKMFLDSERHSSSDNKIIVSDQKQKQDIVKYSFDKILQNYKFDYLYGLIDMIKNNNDGEIALVELWKQYFEKDIAEYQKWIYVALELEILNKIEDEYLRNFSLPFSENFLKYLMRAGKYSYIESIDGFYEYALNVILRRKVTFSYRVSSKSPLSGLQRILSVRQYIEGFRKPSNRPLYTFYNRKSANLLLELSVEKFDGNILDFAKLYEKLSKVSIDVWMVSLDPWDKLVEKGRSIWGDKEAFFIIAVGSCFVKMVDKVSSQYSKFFDDNESLVKRLAFAKQNIRDYTWWIDQSELIKNNSDRFQFLLFLLTWGGYSLVSKLIYKIDECVNDLSVEDWDILCMCLDDIRASSYFMSTSVFRVSNEDYKTWNVSERTWFLLSSRFKVEISSYIFFEKLISYSGSSSHILRFIEVNALENMDREKWAERMVTLIKDVYRRYEHSSSYFTRTHSSVFVYTKVPVTLLKEILGNPDSYPVYFLRLADKTLRSIYEKEQKPMKSLISAKRWVGNF